jgi:hypothetical protein
MNVPYPSLLDRRGELPFRKAGPARYRPVAHIEQRRDTSRGERREHVLQKGFFVTDREKRLNRHSLR